MNLSLTWRARLLNGALSSLALVALVVLAQSRIQAVLYSAVDRAVQSQAEEAAKHMPPSFFDRPHREGERNHDGGPGFPGEPGRGLLFGGRGRGPFGGGGPPILRFGTTSLLPPRRIPLQNRDDHQPLWSLSGYEAARAQGRDLREERDREGT